MMRARGPLPLSLVLATASACVGSVAGDRAGDPGAAPSAGGVAPSTPVPPDRGGPPSTGISSGTAPPAPGEIVAPLGGLRRLTRAELDATLRDLLFDDSRPAAAKLPEEKVAFEYGFDNEASANLETSGSYLEGFEGIAADAVRRALRDPALRDRIVGCVPAGPGDAACMRKFVAGFGRLALRGPLDAEEQALYEGFGKYAVEAGDFYFGVEGALRAMLLNPRFLYRMELGQPVSGKPGLFRLTRHELAARLSYTLLGTTPDAALLDAAERGELHTPAGIEAAAHRLTVDKRAKERMRHFFAYWLGYADDLPPDLARDFLEETNTLVDDVLFDRRRDLRDLFLSDKTYLSSKLRKHYADLALPSSTKTEWVPYGKSGRRGILSHGSVLAGFKTADDTSPTKRGRFIRMRLMCEIVPEPPPDVSVDVTVSATECKTGPDGFFAKSHQGPACKARHDNVDPIGFGLERYDVRGVLRLHDTNKPQCPIDGKGTILTQVSGKGAALEFNGPGELAARLVETGKLDRCAIQHLFRFAAGHHEHDEDRPAIDHLHERFQASGRDFAGALVELVSHPFFAHRRGTP